MTTPQPTLPGPAHPEIDSMLSRKFGKEVANYFSGIYHDLFALPYKAPNVRKAPH